jgi:hypothetical protein
MGLKKNNQLRKKTKAKTKQKDVRAWRKGAARSFETTIT